MTAPRRRASLPRLGVVVPVYGNEGSLPELYRRVVAAMDGLGFEWFLQFVNDRSPDNSQAALEALAAADPRVRVLLLSRNHGSFTAIAAGLAQCADCDAAVFLSADLQDPPEMLPAMAAQWRAGKKVVLCARRSRKDPGFSLLLSRAFHWLYRKAVMPEMPPGGFDFCLIDHCVIRVILQSSEKMTSLVGLIVWAGFDRAVLEYDRAERVHGRSMWTFGKKLAYAFHSVVAFSSFPLRMFALLGLVMLLLSAGGILHVVVATLTGSITIPGWASLVILDCVIIAVQFLGFGILGGYVWNNLEQTRKRPLFIVDKTLGGDACPGQPSAARKRVPGRPARLAGKPSRFPSPSSRSVGNQATSGSELSIDCGRGRVRRPVRFSRQCKRG